LALVVPPIVVLVVLPMNNLVKISQFGGHNT
jgi:hypothetical protein